MDIVTTKKIASLRERLEKTNCPFVEESKSEKELVELLLHPNSKRVKLIKWLVLNFDSSYVDLLEGTMSVVIKHHESLHQQLLVILNTMGLARIDDIELIKGTCSQKKQLTFWDELIDICYTAQVGAPYSESADASFTLPSLMNDQNLKSLHKQKCAFLDSLVRSHKTTDIFNSELQLLPPDLENISKDDQTTVKVPRLIDLECVFNQLCSDIEIITKKINEEKSFHCPDSVSVDKYCRLIDLSLKSFSQRMDTYIYYHSNDIETWCEKRTKPSLSELGHTLHVVSNMHSPLHQLMRIVRRYRKLTLYMMDSLKKGLKDKSLTSLKDVEMNLDQSVNVVLQKALCRKRLSS